MRLHEILIKPILTEKATKQQDTLKKYTFKVAKKANKIEIAKAVETFYSVTVVDVNTSILPGKNKTRFTKAGFLKGVKGGYKKATVTIEKDQEIDLFNAAL